MKYTKEQRREIYYYCMLELTQSFACCRRTRPVCLIIRDWSWNQSGFPQDTYILIKEFPEFLKQKPKGVHIKFSWWEQDSKTGYDDRMNALSKAIELTKNTRRNTETNFQQVK